MLPYNEIFIDMKLVMRSGTGKGEGRCFRKRRQRGAMQSNPPAAAVAAPAYSMSGILNHLQTEWRRFEKERNEWEIERSDLRVRRGCLGGFL